MTPLSTVLVVGSGAMGSQIAMVCALAGLDVRVQDISAESLDRARTSLQARMDRNVAKGRLGAEDRDAAFARMRFTTDLAAAADGVTQIGSPYLEGKDKTNGDRFACAPVATGELAEWRAKWLTIVMPFRLDKVK